jgi:hypothetical protein
MRFLLKIFWVGMLAASAQAAQVEAQLFPADAKIGDKLTLDLGVRGASPGAILFPFPDAEDFTLLGVDSSHLMAEGRLLYSLAVYDTGQHVLPEMPVVITGATPETLYTPQLGVAIHSLAPDTASAILPLKPYREHPFRWIDVWRALKSSPLTWIGALLALAVAGWWIWRRYFRKIPAEELKPVAVLRPHDQAVRDLIALKDRHYPQRGMLKEFYSEYSQIMRAYLEGRYEFPALEMTTFDLERDLEDDKFPGLLPRKLLPTLHEADLVKFAKYIPPFEICDSILETGFEIVALTKPLEVEIEEVKAA